MGAARVAFITGASSGIGKEAAKALAAQGWHVISHGRDAARTASARDEIAAAAAHGARVDMVTGDLALLSDAARLADEVAALTPRLDVFLANAGGVRDERVVTAEGNEATFAGNHLGHFLLARRLMPLLRRAVADQQAAGAPPGSVRVITTSSAAHMVVQAIDWSDLQMLDSWQSVPAYGLAKLANVLFTRELARRVASDGIVVHALHPGAVASNFASHGTEQMREHFRHAQTISPAEAAAPLVDLAIGPEAGRSTGGYWAQGALAEPSALGLDDANAARLWAESERLLAVSGYA